MQSDSIVYFNNCKNRNHVEVYGANAFFDLGTTGLQASMALDLSVGQECVVASLWENNRARIRFDWFSLTTERLLQNEKDELNRVLFGDHIFDEVLPKARASTSKRYQALFNVSGGFKRPSVAYGKVQAKHRKKITKSPKTCIPDEVPSGAYIEGATARITVNSYERSAAARAECLQHHGYRCAACNMSFEETYGSLAADYIHVHHRKQLSSLKRQYRVVPTRDLVPVCPNCHAVIHLNGKNRSIESIKKLLKAAAKP